MHNPSHFPLIMRDLPLGESTAITGVLQGGVLSATAGGTTFSVTDGEGIIVDQYTFPSCPTRRIVKWSGITNVTDAFPTSSLTFLSIDSSGSIVQSTTQPDSVALRETILVGGLLKQAGVIIVATRYLTPAYEHGYMANDMSLMLGPIVTNCTYAGNVGALTASRTTSYFYRPGVNYSSSREVPNVITLPAQNPVQALLASRNNSNTVFSFSPSPVTTFNPTVYDNGGPSTNGVPTGAVATNKWQAARIYLSGTGLTVFQYGVDLYNSAVLAQQGVISETFYPAPGASFLSFRGYLFVRGGATDLSLVGDAVFQPAGKLGDISATVQSGSSTGSSLSVFTVATLPASPSQGNTAAVSDALGPTYLATVVGGGATFTPVVYNGTNWVCY